MKDMVGGNDPFVQVKHENLDQVITILDSRLPRSAHLYNTAVLMKTIKMNVKMYTFQGDLTPNCWIVIIIHRKDYGAEITISVPLNPIITDDIRTAFKTSDIFDWDNRYMFANIETCIAPMILEISALIKQNATIFNPNYSYYMDREEASKLIIQLPENLKIQSMNSESGVNFLVSNWKYKLDGTEEQTRETLQNLASAGIFSGEEPISGIMLNTNGMLGLLHTSNKHRGQGLAQLCMRSLAKSVALQGLIPTSSVEQKNSTSKDFHAKIGMKVSHETIYVIHTGSKW